MQIKMRRKQAQVNIVPLVDVFTALIFFFLLTMDFNDVYSVDITPPTMKSSTVENASVPNVLVIAKDGGYALNGAKTTLAALRGQFDKIAKSDNAAVIVYADAQTQLKLLTDAVDLARLAKIKKLSLRASK
mgnify:FL=1